MKKKKKYYAVREGLAPGLYRTWESCEEAVKGYSGAKFRSFCTEEEAKAYLEEAGIDARYMDEETQGGLPAEEAVSDPGCSFPNGEDSCPEDQADRAADADGINSHTAKAAAGASGFPPAKAADAARAVISAEVTDDDLIAYVDGSYDDSLKRYGYACVLLTPEGEEVLSGSGDDPESLPLRNVAGEMLAAMHAVRYALKEGYQSLEIRYDYAGIENWATGKWKARTTRTRQYGDYMARCSRRLKLSFKKVKAHSGDALNDMADKAARGALSGC